MGRPSCNESQSVRVMAPPQLLSRTFTGRVKIDAYPPPISTPTLCAQEIDCSVTWEWLSGGVGEGVWKLLVPFGAPGMVDTRRLKVDIRPDWESILALIIDPMDGWGWTDG